MNGLIPIGEEWRALKEICKFAVASQLLPSHIKNESQAMIIALKGRELGIPPMQAFQQIFVTPQNKIGIGAELQLAKIYQMFPKAIIQVEEHTDKLCRILVARRKQDKLQEFSFSNEDAQRAGLLSKMVWKQYPKAMLYWRTVSMIAREKFPDALHGASHSIEELGGEMDEDGNIIVEPTYEAIEEGNKPVELEPETKGPDGLSKKLLREQYTGSEDQKRWLFGECVKKGIPNEKMKYVHEKMIEGKAWTYQVDDVLKELRE